MKEAELLPSVAARVCVSELLEVPDSDPPPGSPGPGPSAGVQAADGAESCQSPYLPYLPHRRVGGYFYRLEAPQLTHFHVRTHKQSCWPV